MTWIIVFYQIIVAQPEGEIVFSGLDLGNKFIKTELILPDSYVSKNERRWVDFPIPKDSLLEIPKY